MESEHEIVNEWESEKVRKVKLIRRVKMNLKGKVDMNGM